MIFFLSIEKNIVSRFCNASEIFTLHPKPNTKNVYRAITFSSFETWSILRIEQNFHTNLTPFLSSNPACFTYLDQPFDYHRYAADSCCVLTTPPFPSLGDILYSPETFVGNGGRDLGGLIAFQGSPPCPRGTRDEDKRWGWKSGRKFTTFL